METGGTDYWNPVPVPLPTYVTAPVAPGAREWTYQAPGSTGTGGTGGTGAPAAPAAPSGPRTGPGRCTTRIATPRRGR